MVRNRFVQGLVTLAALTAGAGAQAASFSFASDSNANQWTLVGTAGQNGPPPFFDIHSPLTTPISLRVDDNNGPLNELSVTANLVVNLRAHFASSTPVFGSVFEHDYFIDGTIEFTNPGDPNDKWLIIQVGNDAGAPANKGRMVEVGGESDWGSAGAVIGANGPSTVKYIASQSFKNLIDLLALGQGQGANALSYGIAAGATTTGTDFVFDLTVVNQGPPTGTQINANVLIDPETKLPTTEWRSESSFTGNATIPAPSSLALIATGGLLMLRRRR